MKKISVLLLLFILGLSAQSVKFVWVSNVSNMTSEKFHPDSLINLINNEQNVEFVIFDGVLTKNSERDEYETLYAQLNKLDKKYFLLPSSKDINETGLLYFREFWFDLNFSERINDFLFLGITSESFLKHNKRYFTTETINWLNSVQKDSSDKIIFFYNGDLLNDNVNFDELLTPINESNKLMLMSTKTSSENKLNLLVNGYLKDDDIFSLRICEIKNDTLTVKSLQKDMTFETEIALNIGTETKRISLQPTEETKLSGKVVFNKKFNSTISASPVISENKIFICQQSGLITAIDSLGQIIWQHDVYGDIIGKPAIVENKLIAATRQGDLIIMDVNDGHSIQTIGFDEYITSDLLVIEYTGDKQLFIQKQTNSKAAVIFGTASGKIYCYDVETLQEYWVNKDLKSYVYSSLDYSDDRIVIKTLDGSISCIDAKRGWLIWRWSEKTKNNQASHKYVVAINDKTVYTAGTNGYVFGIDLILGKMKWQSEKFRECNSIAITSDKSKLYVKVYDEKIILLSQKTGTNLNVIKYSNGFDNAFGKILQNDNVLYVTQGEGEIFRITDFRKSEKVFSLSNEILLDVSHYKENLYLISTIGGRIILSTIE